MRLYIQTQQTPEDNGSILSLGDFIIRAYQNTVSATTNSDHLTLGTFVDNDMACSVADYIMAEIHMAVENNKSDLVLFMPNSEGEFE